MPGTRVHAKKPNKKEAKLDYNTSNGIFIGYTVRTKNVYFKDKKINNLKIGVHTLFDEAHLHHQPHILYWQHTF